MGKPLTIQQGDDQRLEALKYSLGRKTKIDVLRLALDSLEEKVERQKKMERISRAAKIVAGESKKVNREFQRFSRLHKA